MLKKILLPLLLLPVVALADIGPKPTAYFLWKTGVIDPAKVSLLQCKLKTCLETAPLKELGPQRMRCCGDGCMAMAYGFSEFSQLSLKTKDGTLTSAPFESPKQEGYYGVALYKGELLVKKEASPFDDATKSKLWSCP